MELDQELNLGSTQTSAPVGTNGPASSPLRSSIGHASILYSRFQPSNQVPGIIRLLMKIKIAKNEKQAEKITLVIIFFIIIFAIALFLFAFKDVEVNI